MDRSGQVMVTKKIIAKKKTGKGFWFYGNGNQLR